MVNTVTANSNIAEYPSPEAGKTKRHVMRLLQPVAPRPTAGSNRPTQLDDEAWIVEV